MLLARAIYRHHTFRCLVLYNMRNRTLQCSSRLCFDDVRLGRFTPSLRMQRSTSTKSTLSWLQLIRIHGQDSFAQRQRAHRGVINKMVYIDCCLECVHVIMALERTKLPFVPVKPRPARPLPRIYSPSRDELGQRWVGHLFCLVTVGYPCACFHSCNYR